MHFSRRPSTDSRNAVTGPAHVPQSETPRRAKAGAALEEFIVAIENEWQLGLKMRGPLWSPHKSRNVQSTADKVYGLIKRLFFTSRPALDAALKSFRDAALAPGCVQGKRVHLLHGVLKATAQSPMPETSTPKRHPLRSLGTTTECEWKVPVLTTLQ